MKLLKPSKITSPLSVKQALNTAVEVFTNKKISSAWLDAEILLAFILTKDRAFVISHGELLLTQSQHKTFNSLVKLRSRHFPIAYLTSHQEFYGLDFFVNSNVLVPRPESELLVDLAVNAYISEPTSTIIDIGTGSGCLIISTLYSLKNNKNLPHALALDISGKALAVAKKNARTHQQKNITFIQGNLLQPLFKIPSFLNSKNSLIILANLPYVPTTIMNNEPSISQEPIQALDGGPDGLTYYRQLALEIKKLITIRPSSITIVCEINPEQKKDFKEIWKYPVIFKKDLAEKTRIAIVTIKKIPA